MKYYRDEYEGQREFYNRVGIFPDLSHNTDGVDRGNLYENKKSIENIYEVLSQAIKYASRIRIRGELLPANLILNDLNREIVYIFQANDLLEDIEKVYFGAASKNNETFNTDAKYVTNESHEQAYTEMMDRWEATGDKVAPQLLGRYSSKHNRNVSYSRWLEWCEDDRTTGSALSTKVPCTLYFLMNDCGEILGSIVINHSNTRRGHLHAGITPWNRNKGYGSIMLKLALDKCKAMGMSKVDIVPNKNNEGAIKLILKNGGILIDEFYDEDILSLRYSIEL